MKIRERVDSYTSDDTIRKQVNDLLTEGDNIDAAFETAFLYRLSQSPPKGDDPVSLAQMGIFTAAAGVAGLRSVNYGRDLFDEAKEGYLEAIEGETEQGIAYDLGKKFDV